MGNPENSSSNPLSTINSNGKGNAVVTKEQEVFQAIEKVGVSGVLGFLVGSLQRFSQLPRRPPTQNTSPTEGGRGVGAPRLPPSSPIIPNNTPVIRPDEVAGQVARRGGVFALLAVLYTGTLESSRLFRDKVDLYAYICAGSLAGLTASVFLGAGAKTAAKQTFFFATLSGLYSMMQERFPSKSTPKPSPTNSSSSSPSPSSFSDKIDETKKFFSSQQPNKKEDPSNNSPVQLPSEERRSDRGGDR